MNKSLFGNRPFGLPPRNAMLDMANALRSPPSNAMYDWRPKTEWVAGYWRRVPNFLLGSTLEWVPGYWRREG
jgi:hypothetical protein